MLVKHVLASSKDRKPTIMSNELKEFVDEKVSSVLLFYDQGFGSIVVKYNKTRGGKTWYPEDKFPKELNMPKIGEPILLEVKQIKTY